MIRIFVSIGLLAVIYAQSTTPASVQCGKPKVTPITKRIVGGKNAAPGSWPWTTMLVDAFGYIKGSGALIDQHVVLTGARNFEGRGFSVFDLPLRYWRVYTGKYNISTTDPHQKYYRISKVIIHPGFNYTSLENDIALIILKTPVVYNVHTLPACLPDPAHTYTVGNTCYLAGWGSTAHSGNEEVMNQVDLPIIADSICQQHFKGFIPNTEICAGYENAHKDWCTNDIGSPLMCKAPSGAWYIQGLASSGGNCVKANEPSVFEDVSQYSGWIKKTMEDANFPYQF